MARLTRKDLKSDKFALEVGHTVDFFEHHRTEMYRYGAGLLVLAIIVFGVSAYRGHQHDLRQQAMADAILAQEAPVGGGAPGTPLTFPTQEAKSTEVAKRFSEISAKFSGSGEATIAEYYLAAIAADAGKIGEAEKRYKSVLDNGDSKYAPLAKMALAQLYFVDGRVAQAEQILRELIANPTIFVSREAATIVLARGLAKSKPAEARKLVEPLRTSRSAVSQAAINLYGELSGQ